MTLILPGGQQPRRLILPNNIETAKALDDAHKLRAQAEAMGGGGAIPAGEVPGFTKLSEKRWQYICDGQSNARAKGAYGHIVMATNNTSRVLEWHWEANGINCGRGGEQATPAGLDAAKRLVVMVCYGKEGTPFAKSK